MKTTDALTGNLADIAARAGEFNTAIACAIKQAV
jgi:hypothetical protein